MTQSVKYTPKCKKPMVNTSWVHKVAQFAIRRFDIGPVKLNQYGYSVGGYGFPTQREALAFKHKQERGSMLFMLSLGVIALGIAIMSTPIAMLGAIGVGATLAFSGPIVR